MSIKLAGCVLGFVALGCGSPWKISGGPKECVSMCRGWDMELAGMVGVGDQGPSEGGATACVCQVRGKTEAADTGSAGIAAGSSAVIAAIQEAERQKAAEEQAENAK
jgi:hypothetical protein